MWIKFQKWYLTCIAIKMEWDLNVIVSCLKCITCYNYLEITYTVIDWTQQPLQQPKLRVSLRPPISNLQLVVWLLFLWISTQCFSKCPFNWFLTSGFIDRRDQSHYQAAHLNLAVIKSTHPVLAAVVGVNLDNRLRCHFLNIICKPWNDHIFSIY